MVENNTATKVSYEFTYNNIPLIIICILGVDSNILLLVAFIKDPLKCFRNSGTYLVMNLSFSDCLMSSILPFHFEAGNEIDARTVWHWIIQFLVFWFGGVSFLSITSVSIDRFVMVTYPIKHRILMDGKFIFLWLTAIWIVSFVIATFSLIHIDKHGVNIANIASVIVIILSSVMYLSTYYKLKKQSRDLNLQNSTDSRAQEIRILKEKRFLKTIIIIACVSVGCVVPTVILHLNRYNFLFLSKDNLTSEVIGTASLLLFYISFAVNPFIYILRLPNYRKTFFMLYCRRSSSS